MRIFGRADLVPSFLDFFTVSVSDWKRVRRSSKATERKMIGSSLPCFLIHFAILRGFYSFAGM